MSIETPMLIAFIIAWAGVLIAVMFLASSVCYRLGKLEEGQETLARKDEHTRELIAKNREAAARENAHTRELISNTREIATRGNAHSREMVLQGDAHTRELIMRGLAAYRERSDAQHAETMSAIQRLTNAFLSHSHDQYGAIRFRVPPPEQPPLPADEAA